MTRPAPRWVTLPGFSYVLSPSDTLNVSLDKSITKELCSNVIWQEVTTSVGERTIQWLKICLAKQMIDHHHPFMNMHGIFEPQNMLFLKCTIIQSKMQAKENPLMLSVVINLKTVFHNFPYRFPPRLLWGQILHKLSCFRGSR